MTLNIPQQILLVSTPIEFVSIFDGVAMCLQRTSTWSYKNKNFIDPHSTIDSKFGASISWGKTNKKYNRVCNMTFTTIINSCF